MGAGPRDDDMVRMTITGRLVEMEPGYFRVDFDYDGPLGVAGADLVRGADGVYVFREAS